MGQNEELGSAFKWLGKKYLGSYLWDTNVERVKEEIRRRVFSEVNEIILKTGQKNLPVDLSAIARFRKAEVYFTKLLSCNSLLLPKNGGFVIKVDSNLPLFKMRVAIAHELGHTFFYDVSFDPPQKAYSYRGSKYWEEHGFAFEIAREILLPAALFKELVCSGFEFPSLSALGELSKKCEVSYEILRLKLVNDLSLWDCVIFRSTIENDKITTRKRDISKGQSYSYIRIPQLLHSDTKGYGELCTALSSVKEREKVETAISIREEEYKLQSIFLPPSSAFTILLRK